MAVTLGSNIAALRASRSLSSATDALGRVFERLSSGSRLNRASDDAAGISVALQLTLKSRILNRARLNLQDATSVLNVADGALDQVGGLLGRLSELAEQAANGTFSSTQRATMQKEYGALEDEIKRITESTSFNGIALIAGKATTRSGTVTYTDSVNGVLAQGISGDGRYTIFTDSNDASTLGVRDSVTGEVKQIAAPTGRTIKGTAAKVLANGDVIFEADTASRGDLYYFSQESGTTTKLTNSKSSQDIYMAPSFNVSADGTTLVFFSDTNYTDGGTVASGVSGSTHQLYSLDLTSGTVRRLASLNIGAFDLTVSADGSYYGVDDAFGNVYVGNTRGATLSIKSASSSIARFNHMIGVSNTGTAYFDSTYDFTGANSSHFHQIYSINAASGTVSQLTSFSEASSHAASFSVDGNSLYLTAASNGVYQLYRLDTTSNGLTQLSAYTSANPMSIAYLSADGTKGVSQTGDGLSLYETDLSQDANNFDFEAGFGASGNIVASLQSVYSAIRGLSAFSLTGVIGARGALAALNQNIANLAQLRGVLGAGLSRVDIGARLATDQRDQSSAALGRVQDADIAGESAELIRRQIQQQAASAVLAQANQQPALALRLLR